MAALKLAHSSQLSLDLFCDRLPSRPLCSDNVRIDGLYRERRSDALERLLIQPNTSKRVVSLCFDVDRAGAAIDWNDRNCPPPNLSVKNPANGHAHLIYLLAAPVPISDVARIRPVEYMAAVQEGLRRALAADRGYAGVVVKNPKHKHWQTHAWRETPYQLDELADYVTLPSPQELRQKAKEPDYAGLGRNCTLFEVVRQQAYRLVKEYWGPEGDRRFHAAVRELVQTANYEHLGKPLGESECRAIARSIAKWTWQHFNRAEFRKVQAARGQRKGAAKREELLAKAVAMKAEGKTQREIAAALGVNQATIARWLKRPS